MEAFFFKVFSTEICETMSNRKTMEVIKILVGGIRRRLNSIVKVWDLKGLKGKMKLSSLEIKKKREGGGGNVGEVEE